MPSNVPVGTVELGQKEVNDLYDLVGMPRREIKRKSVKEEKILSASPNVKKCVKRRTKPKGDSIGKACKVLAVCGFCVMIARFIAYRIEPLSIFKRCSLKG